MADDLISLRGRGAAENPPNRFELIHYQAEGDEVPFATDGEDAENDAAKPVTKLYKDTSRSIITYNDSPDVGFDASINPYRGCEHGCIYCYARPTHEYLGFSAGLDFETKILVKEDAPELLRKELASKRWQPQPLALSGVTDAYQPIERKLQITRRCLEVLAEFRNPVIIITKNRLVTRDIDYLKELACHEAAAVFLSITTLDGDLARVMEPRASHPEGRVAAIQELAEAGVSVGVLTAPVIPGLTDHEIPAIISAAVKAGARYAGYVVLRLPHGLGPLFEEWLSRQFPDRKDKVLGRIKQLRGGKINDPRFGKRMKGEGVFADLIKDVFTLTCRKEGILGRKPTLSAAAFRRTPRQPFLFDY